jgi:hypothetical protein
MGHILYINILTAGKTARSIQMNKENFKMKKISSIKMGEVAKNAAKILAKAVGKGLGTGLKIGGMAALGLGAVGCESTPAYSNQIISGVAIDSYQGNDPYIKGKNGTFYVVDQDGNPETKQDQRLFYVGNENRNKYPNLQIGSYITFAWTAVSERDGFSNDFNLISVK